MATQSIDLNSDLGESYGHLRLGDDASMFRIVSSANIACGFHGGDPSTILATCRLATQHGVAVGAHPSYPDLAGFGRRDMEMTPDDLYADIVYQFGALAGIAEVAGTSIRYVKAHGALYNRAAVDDQVAGALIRALVDHDRSLPLLGLAGSALEHAAETAGVTFVREAFSDRAILPDGRLVPRTAATGAVISDPLVAAKRAVRLATEGEVEAIDGSLVRVDADSICVHGDTPGAVAIALAVREALTAAGVEISAFT